jgi:ABC-type dipeptide/oligopeptide/nickel transport system ATPase component
MQNGRLVEEGPVREILREPKERYTRTLLASMLEGKEPMTMLVSAGSSATASSTAKENAL